MHDHKKVVCKCGEVVMQCRCMTTDKRIETVETCTNCEAKRKQLAAETPDQQKIRIKKQVGLQIINLQAKGIPNEEIVVHLLDWLTEARIELEQLKAKRRALLIV